ncbi:MAG TPA: TetR/AcrR family transcriptional regulator [Caulobacteraceae bacterium]
MARAYRSARREAQSASTRQDILDAARSLFERHGYASTTMDMIAERAKMSTGTIYTTFRTKPSVLKAILDTFHRGLPDDISPASTLTDQQRASDLLREVVQRMVELCSSADGILSAAWSAARSDPDFANWWEREEAARWHEFQSYVAGWSAAGILRSGLSVTEATDLLWTMTGPAAIKSFIADCGWPAGRYASWLAAMLGEVLLRQAPAESSDVAAEPPRFADARDAPPASA